MKAPVIATLALGAALIVAAPAAAQTTSTSEQSTPTAQQAPPGPGPGRGWGMRRGMGPGMMRGRGMGRGYCAGGMGGMGMGGGMAMMRYPDGTLAFLKAELKIKDSQSKQWNAFAHALRSSADAMQKMRAQHWSNRPQTLKGWLQRREDGAAMRLETMRHMSKALIPLYDSLDATQKKTADALFMPCSRAGMRRGMGWWNQPEDSDDDSD